MNDLQVYCIKKDDSVNVLKSIINPSKIYLDIDFFKYKNKIHTFGFKYFNYLSCVNKILNNNHINIDSPDRPYLYFNDSSHIYDILKPFYNSTDYGDKDWYGGCHYKVEDDILENHVYKDIIKKTATTNITNNIIKSEDGTYSFDNIIKVAPLQNNKLNRYVFYSTPIEADNSESLRDYNFYQVLIYYTDVIIEKITGINQSEFVTEKRWKVEFVYKDEL